MKQLLVTLLICASFAAIAEPTPATRFLMHDSVSALDFGMFRLEQRYRYPQHQPPLQFAANQSPMVNYDWDANRIEVALLIQPDSKESRLTKEAEKALCRAVIRNARLIGGVDPDTGKSKENFETLANLFRPASHQNPKAPANLDDEILTMITFKAWIYRRNDDGSYTSPNTRCSGPLLANEILFIE